MQALRKYACVSLLVFAVAASLVSCKKGTKAATTVTKRVITVATSGSPSPWIFVNDKGDPEGYDIDALKAAFDKLPQYELEFKVTEFASIFGGLDTGLYQIGCNHLGYNRQRGEKYLYSVVQDVGNQGILIREDRTDIQSIYDLGGHSTIVTPTNANSTTFKLYNEKHPENPVDLHFSDIIGDYTLQVLDGSIDFYYFTKFGIEQKLQDTGVKGLKLLNVPIQDSFRFTGQENRPWGTFYIFPKGEEQLRDDFDEVFLALIRDGTIHNLREKYFGIAKDEDDLTVEFAEKDRQLIAEDLAQL